MLKKKNNYQNKLNNLNLNLNRLKKDSAKKAKNYKS